MDSTTAQTIVAVFAGRPACEACFEQLQDQGFEKPWMALTRPALGVDLGDALATTAPSKNEIASPSDGPVGTVSRFLGGQGNSLRRVLEERGLDAATAARIDGNLPPQAAVLIAKTDVRFDVATRIAESAGGDIAASF